MRALNSPKYVLGVSMDLFRKVLLHIIIRLKSYFIRSSYRKIQTFAHVELNEA